MDDRQTPWSFDEPIQVASSTTLHWDSRLQLVRKPTSTQSTGQFIQHRTDIVDASDYLRIDWSYQRQHGTPSGILERHGLRKQRFTINPSLKHRFRT